MTPHGSGPRIAPLRAWLAAVAYLAAAMAFALLANHSQANYWPATLLVLVTSALVGREAGRPVWAFLALALTPIAAPFGYPDHYTSEPTQVWAWAVTVTPFSAALVALFAWLRRWRGSSRRWPT